ncbi:glycine cleavage system aminomethyltransferase GcvT [Ideonella dechloratans]|uniref:aminomethyltransferase n=1 Tax=Ideonella dechloratans TaxID=36863 RepID=A0A643FAS5_IDEDE|nr:glycine cleavage system aminomethyltransferase GcvT [Ideonella dechloratans]KAB0575080.1 glycine cleavage system aminomethyltransferase GcvT [Ideonella dechloratans]UFU08682.1 glycine cleavage system aminomethyltransferase GcvT [Ideonella dechloratans]
MSDAADLFQTPLHALHLELGARMVPFAGYAMPVQYPSGLMAEHRQCREAAALFDVSHMGQLRLIGADAAAALETLVPVDVIDLPAGKQRYAFFTNDEGGLLDDLMITRPAGDAAAAFGDLFVVVNAGCKDADIAHLQARIGSRCTVQPLPERALLALQGPQAVTALSRLNPGVATLTFMTGGLFTLAGAECFVTRSGYTGEDGFEISVHESQAMALARALLAEPEVKPAGLGARDTLRLEAGLCLYGHDIDTTTNPVEAALTWAIQKVRRAGGARAGGYPGAAVIDAQFANGPTRKRVGLVGKERAPVREGTALVAADGTPLGTVTSGTLGPTVNTPVAMAYLPVAHAAVGTEVFAEVRGKRLPMTVAAMPFTPNRYYRG